MSGSRRCANLFRNWYSGAHGCSVCGSSPASRVYARASLPGDPQPMQHPAQLIVGFERVAVATSGQRLGTVADAVELKESVPISPYSVIFHTGRAAIRSGLTRGLLKTRSENKPTSAPSSARALLLRQQAEAARVRPRDCSQIYGSALLRQVVRPSWGT